MLLAHERTQPGFSEPRVDRAQGLQVLFEAYHREGLRGCAGVAQQVLNLMVGIGQYQTEGTHCEGPLHALGQDIEEFRQGLRRQNLQFPIVAAPGHGLAVAGFIGEFLQLPTQPPVFVFEIHYTCVLTRSARADSGSLGRCGEAVCTNGLPPKERPSSGYL